MSYGVASRSTRCKEEYIGQLMSLKGFKNLLPGFDVSELDRQLDESDWFDPWTEKVDEMIAPGRCAVGAMDISGDCYDIFVCRIPEIETLRSLALDLFRIMNEMLRCEAAWRLLRLCRTC